MEYREEGVTHRTSRALLETVEHWRPWLLSVKDKQARLKPAADRWAIIEVMGHLIDSACNNHQRFVRATVQDTLEFPKYDQNVWVTAADYIGADWPATVELWAVYNRLLARVIEGLPLEKLATICTITPYEPCTLEYLVTDYVEHMRHHLEKIRERCEQ